MEELKRLREQKGWSQSRLARESGLDRATINQVEGGRRSPTIATLEILAESMGVEVADFFPKVQAALPFERAGQPSAETAERYVRFGELMVEGWLLELADRMEHEDVAWFRRITILASEYTAILRELNLPRPRDGKGRLMDINAAMQEVFDGFAETIERRKASGTPVEARDEEMVAARTTG